MRICTEWLLAPTLLVLLVARFCLCLFVSLDLDKVLLELDEMSTGGDHNKPNPIDWFLQDFLTNQFGMRSSNENGTRSEFRDYLLMDSSNDNAVRLSAFLTLYQQEMITRSGFRYELYDSIADDGYITEITRIVNPLVKREHLRKPPVLMEHGGTIDPTAYLISSSIQHHPEPWPRPKDYGPISSWNRSLAFVLANNGFDVWLAETRGANEKNLRKVSDEGMKVFAATKNQGKNMTRAESMLELIHHEDYWSFSQDDIIAHELKSHMDTVMELTGSKRVHLFSFSLSTPIALAFLGTRPDYASKVQGFISMSPIVSGEGGGLVAHVILQKLCPILPDQIGNLIITDVLLTQPFRELLILFSSFKSVRYTLVKGIIAILYGSSAKYQTLIDLNLIGHLLRHVSFKEAKQLCQQMKSNRLQKFDYGPVKNQILYNSTVPPVYNISDLQIDDWMVITGANDNLATLEAVDHLYKLVNPKPLIKIVVPGFNHLDMIAGVDNDKYVNLPILEYLIEISSIRHEDEVAFGRKSGARSLNVRSVFPKEINLENIGQSIANVTNIFNPELMDQFQRGISEFLDTITKTIKETSEQLLNFGTKRQNRTQV